MMAAFNSEDRQCGLGLRCRALNNIVCFEKMYLSEVNKFIGSDILDLCQGSDNALQPDAASSSTERAKERVSNAHQGPT